MPACSTPSKRAEGRAHRPWPRAVVDDDGWSCRRASWRPAAGRCSACGATPAPCTWRCSTRAPATSPSSATNARTGHFPRVGALHPPAIRLERAIRDLYGLEPRRRSRHAALARPRLLGRAASARRAHETADARALSLPADGRRRPAPDPGRAGACRHHRARAFPLHRQWRDRGAARSSALATCTRASSR